MEEEIEKALQPYLHLGDQQIGRAMVKTDRNFAIRILLNYYASKPHNSIQYESSSNNKKNPAT
jgi:hypothetical protein